MPKEFDLRQAESPLGSQEPHQSRGRQRLVRAVTLGLLGLVCLPTAAFAAYQGYQFLNSIPPYKHEIKIDLNAFNRENPYDPGNPNPISTPPPRLYSVHQNYHGGFLDGSSSPFTK